MTSNSDRIDALADVTLAIARAAAGKDVKQANQIETGVRQSLVQRAHQPDAFREALEWLKRFEQESSGS